MVIRDTLRNRMIRTKIIHLFLFLSLAGCHSLQKIDSGKSDHSLTDTYWKLIELNGRAVQQTETTEPEAHIMLHAADGRMTGNGGCNAIGGSFETRDANQISFSEIIATRMACPDMEIEDRLMKALESADSYSIKSDTLTLNRPGMTPLARFVAETLQSQSSD
jgi:heat shock protein HslJ